MSLLSFEEIVNKYSKNVYNLAYRMVGNAPDAEDIVQDTFYQVYSNIDQFRAQSSLYTWIYRICANECLRQRKKRKLQYSELLDEDYQYVESRETTDWMNNPENTAAVKELTEFIRQECHHIVMQKLTEAQRIVYIMRVIMELSYSDIAEILETSENVVKSRLNRARERLLSHFNNDCNWFRTGGDSSCCSKKIGYALSRDIEILKRLDEDIEDYGISSDRGNNNQVFVDYIYSRLPAVQYDTGKIKIK